MIGAFDQRLAHMGDVEQPGRLARMAMLGQDAGRIMDRHVVAGEGRHARAELDVQSVEGSLPNCVFAHGTTGRIQAPNGIRGRTNGRPIPAPPLSHDLRDFPPPAVTPVGGRKLTQANAAFQSVITSRSLGPERFRGGCAFGAGGRTAGLFREASSTDGCQLARADGLCQRSVGRHLVNRNASVCAAWARRRRPRSRR